MKEVLPEPQEPVRQRRCQRSAKVKAIARISSTVAAETSKAFSVTKSSSAKPTRKSKRPRRNNASATAEETLTVKKARKSESNGEKETGSLPVTVKCTGDYFDFDAGLFLKNFAGFWPENLKHFMAGEEEVLRIHKHYIAGLPFPKSGASPQAKVVVLSESPAKTPNDFFDHQRTFTSADSQYPHTDFVNLVHCLLYGEPNLVPIAEPEIGKSAKASAGRGTPEFWRVLATLAGDAKVDGGVDPLDDFNTCFANITCKDHATRMVAKKAILEKLKTSGIFFFDTCPAPIYLGSGKKWVLNKKTGVQYHTPLNKLTDKQKKQALQSAFVMYSLPILKSLNPDKIVILGRTVEKAIVPLLNEEFNVPILTVTHPSFNKVKGEKYAPHLKEIRDFIA